MDVQRSGGGEVRGEHFLASMLRPLAGELETADIPGLLKELSAPAAGDGTFEKLSRLTNPQVGGEVERSESLSTLGLPSQGGFLALPMSLSARELFEALRVAFRSNPPESVTPRQIVTWTLRASSQLRELCERFGVTPEMLESGG